STRDHPYLHPFPTRRSSDLFDRLIQSEGETSSGREHHNSAISEANYAFALVGEEDVGPYRCFVLTATPKRKDKYLFEGKIWIDEIGRHTSELQSLRHLVCRL